MDQEAARPVARTDDRSVAPPFERVLVGRERQPALAFVLAVALEAVLLDERTNLALIVDAGLGANGGDGGNGEKRGRYREEITERAEDPWPQESIRARVFSETRNDWPACAARTTSNAREAGFG